MQEYIYSHQDFESDNPPKRIEGGETEYIIANKNGNKDLTGDDLDPILGQFHTTDNIRRAGLIIINDNGHLSTGARLYKDSKVEEFASNEALGPVQTDREIAKGRQLLIQMGSLGLDEEGLPLDVEIYNRTGHINLNDHFEGKPSFWSVGNQQNHLTIPKAVFDPKKLAIIASYLATSPIYRGAGMLWTPEDDINENAFRFSQKAEDTNKITSGKRTARLEKPMLAIHRLENDKHAKAGNSDYPRLELRCLDELNQRSIRVLGYACTSLILRLLEHDSLTDEDMDKILLKNPPEVMQEVSSDLFLNNKYTNMAGQEVTAIEHQRHLAEIAEKMTKDVNLPEDEVIATNEWLKTCDNLEAWKNSNPNKPYERDDTLAYDHSEAIARLHVIKQKCGHTALNCLNFKASQIDIKWNRVYAKADDSDIKKNRTYKPGIGELFWDRSKKRHNPFGVEDLEPDAFKQAPVGTRAAGRQRLFEQYDGNISAMNWNFVKPKKTDHRFTNFDAYNPEFERS